MERTDFTVVGLEHFNIHKSLTDMLEEANKKIIVHARSQRRDCVLS